MPKKKKKKLNDVQTAIAKTGGRTLAAANKHMEVSSKELVFGTLPIFPCTFLHTGLHPVFLSILTELEGI